jgi:hypothetical protein
VETIAAHYRGNAPKTPYLENLRDDDAYWVDALEYKPTERLLRLVTIS